MYIYDSMWRIVLACLVAVELWQLSYCEFISLILPPFDTRLLTDL